MNKKIINKKLLIGLGSIMTISLPMATIISCEGDDSKLDLAMKSIDKVIDGYLNGKNRIQLTKYGSDNKKTTKVDTINKSNLKLWFDGLPPIVNVKNNDGVTFYLRSVGAKGTSGNDKTTLEIKWIATKDNVVKEMVYTETGFLASDATNPDQEEVNAEKTRLDGLKNLTSNDNSVLASSINTIDLLKQKVTGLNLNEKFTYTLSVKSTDDTNGTLNFQIKIDKNSATATTKELTATGFAKQPNPNQEAVNAEKERLDKTNPTGDENFFAAKIDASNIKDKLSGLELKSEFEYTFESIKQDGVKGEVKFTIKIVKDGATATTKELTAAGFAKTPVFKKVDAEKNSAGKVTINIEGTNLPTDASEYKITKKDDVNPINNWGIQHHGADDQGVEKVSLTKNDANDLSGELTISFTNLSEVEARDAFIIEFTNATVTKDVFNKVTITITGNGLPIPTNGADANSVAEKYGVKKQGAPDDQVITGWIVEGDATSTEVVLTKENVTDLNVGDNLEIWLKTNPNLEKKQIAITQIPTQITSIIATKDKDGKIGITVNGTNLPKDVKKYLIKNVNGSSSEEDLTDNFDIDLPNSNEKKVELISKTSLQDKSGTIKVSLNGVTPAIEKSTTIVEITNITAEKDANDKVTITITGNGLPIPDDNTADKVAEKYGVKLVGDSQNEIANWIVEGQASSTKVVLTQTIANLSGDLEIWLKGTPKVSKVISITQTPTTISSIKAEKDKIGKVEINIKGTNLPIINVNKYNIVNVNESNQEVLLDSKVFEIKPESDGVLLSSTAYPNISGKIKISLNGAPSVAEKSTTIVEIKNVIAEIGAQNKVTITITGNGLPTTASGFDIEKKVGDSLTKIDDWQIEKDASNTKVVLTKENETNLNEGDTLVITLKGNSIVNREVTISAFSTTNGFKINNITGELVEYTGSTTEIEIPVEVKSIAQDVFKNKGITQLTFATGSQLTTIGNEAFIGNSIAGTLTIPASVTTIGERAFFNNKITQLTFATGSIIKDMGISAFANNEISGLLDLSHLDKLRTTRTATFDNNKITELKFHRNLMSFAGGVFSNNEISKVNSDVEGEFRFYYGTIIRGNQLTNVNVNNKAFFKNKITKVFYNDKIKFLNGNEQFDPTIKKIEKQKSDYNNDTGILENTNDTTTPTLPTSSSIVNWLRKRLKK